MNRLRAYPFLYLLLILIKPYSFCKYYNSTCYKLFFSSDSDTQSNTETISDVTITWDKISNNGTEACVEPGYENICSGHGNCSNSSCQCNRLEPLDNESESLFEYSGKFCEECPYCKGQRCKKICSMPGMHFTKFKLRIRLLFSL
ncbi:hypothetical protein NQ314_008175 [Rhamnusium bicolor]|uniref:Uncharacterized protein n=1 Tax=Rhamnusium bicolor TaxID=1586634 RepID=A0AAV8YDY6_9CUCU|nr:hypothetical protein NQ314_008175 [Rhamnusium bicolor]